MNRQVDRNNRAANMQIEIMQKKISQIPTFEEIKGERQENMNNLLDMDGSDEDQFQQVNPYREEEEDEEDEDSQDMEAEEKIKPSN